MVARIFTILSHVFSADNFLYISRNLYIGNVEKYVPSTETPLYIHMSNVKCKAIPIRNSYASATRQQLPPQG